MSIQNINSIDTAGSALPQIQPSTASTPAKKAQTVAFNILCQACGLPPAEKKMCGGCRQVYYCSPACQKADWPAHKPNCLTAKAVQGVKSVSNTSTKIQTPSDVWTAKVEGMEGKKVKLTHWEAQSYRIQPEQRTYGFLYFSDCISLLCLQINDSLQKFVEDKLKQSSNMRGMVMLLPGTTIKKNIPNWMEDLKEALKVYNYPMPESLLLKLPEFFEDYFNTHPLISISTDSPEEIVQSLKMITHDIIRFHFNNKQKYDFDIVKTPITITNDELKVFDCTLDSIDIDLEDFSCGSYTLLKEGVRNAKDVIFDPKLPVMRLLENLLFEGGYEPVVVPQSGDLVVYFNDKFAVPHHNGKCLSNGLIQSKQGVKNPYS